jgi:hypothetical protein
VNGVGGANQICVKTIKYCENILTKEHFGVIIALGGGEVIREEHSHKGIDTSTIIDKSVIESSDYRRMFDHATENKELNKALYKSAKEMLKARSGSHYESMRWLDGETGKILAEFDEMGRKSELTGEEHEFKVEYPDGFLQKLKGFTNIVVIHNHPNSGAPSAGDFNSAYKRGYKCGFVVTHDGRLFRYSSNHIIDNNTYQAYWRKFLEQGIDSVKAQIKAIEQFMYNGDVTFTEVLSNDMV